MATHGGRMVYQESLRIASQAPLERVPRTSPIHNTVRSFLATAGRSALVSALIHGLGAAVPPLGAVLLPAYVVYGYSKAGRGLYETYKSWRSGISTPQESMKEAAGTSTGVAMGDASSRLAETMVSDLERSGIIKEIATQTNVDSTVYREMLKGSLDSASSNGFEALAKFAVGRALGA